MENGELSRKPWNSTDTRKKKLKIKEKKKTSQLSVELVGSLQYELQPVSYKNWSIEKENALCVFKFGTVRPVTFLL